jgi:hypothetical protein
VGVKEVYSNYMLRKSGKQLTVRFLQRTTLFLVCFSAGLFLFYVYGNVQGFLDSTQTIILQCLSATALIAVLLSLILFSLELLLLAVKKKSLYVGPLLVSFFCMVVSLTLALLSHAVVILSRGFLMR